METVVIDRVAVFMYNNLHNISKYYSYHAFLRFNRTQVIFKYTILAADNSPCSTHSMVRKSVTGASTSSK